MWLYLTAIEEIGTLEKYRDAALDIEAWQYSGKVEFVQKVKVKLNTKTNLTGASNTRFVLMEVFAVKDGFIFNKHLNVYSTEFLTSEIIFIFSSYIKKAWDIWLKLISLFLNTNGFILISNSPDMGS